MSPLQTEPGETRSHPPHRWYLRPWLLLLTTIVLGASAIGWPICLKLRAIAAFNNAEFQVVFVRTVEPNFVQRAFAWLPPALYCDFATVCGRLPRDPNAAQQLIDLLPQISPVVSLTLSDADEELPIGFNKGRPIEHEFVLRPIASPVRITLPRLPSLQKLKLTRVELEPLFFDHLQASPDLTVLELQGVALDQDDIAKIGQLPALTTLILEYCLADGADLTTLAGSQTLERLTLRDPQLSDSSVASLAKVKKLHSLRIMEAQISSAAFEPFQQCDINELFLKQIPLKDRDVEQILQYLPRIEYLALEKLAMTDQTTVPLMELSQLQYLELDGIELSPKLRDRLANRRFKWLRINSEFVTSGHREQTE